MAAAAVVVFLRFARARSDYILFPATLLALALIGLCAVTSALGALLLWRAVRRAPVGLPPGVDTVHPVAGGFRFPRLAYWPLLQVSMRVETPAEVEVRLTPVGRFFAETLVFGERGVYPRVVRRFTVSDLFGLTAISFSVSWAHSLRVAPVRSAPCATLAAGRASGEGLSHPAGKQEGELIEVRRYGAGDPLRHVLWKTFARTRRLLVRMPERALAPHPTTAAYLIAGALDEPTASTARLFLEDGLLGRDFLFLADGGSRPTPKTGEAVDQIIASRACRADGGQGLERFLRTVDLPRLGGCIVFAPPRDGVWRDRLIAFSRRLPSPATVILGVDGPLDTPVRGRLARLLQAPSATTAVPAGLLALATVLRTHGMKVAVLHRSTGQLLSEQALRRS